MENKPVFTQQFVLEIASDWDDPVEICANHKVSPEEYDRLLAYQPFLESVAEMRKSLTDNEITAAFKAKMAVEDLIPEIYRIAKHSDEEKLKIEAFAQLQKLAGLDSGSNLVTAGHGYSLNISFAPPAAPIEQVVEIEALSK